MQHKRSRHLHPELLDTLLAVHAHGNFKLAGKSLNITQSAVSQRLGRLEETLGVPLMRRHSPIALTAAGVRVVEYATAVRQLALAVASELALQGGLQVAGPSGELENFQATSSTPRPHCYARASSVP